jgi:hypothetical protein
MPMRNKSDIVALMQDAVVADILVPDACLRGGWRDATTAIARRTRDVLMPIPGRWRRSTRPSSGPTPASGPWGLGWCWRPIGQRCRAAPARPAVVPHAIASATIVISLATE